jgi:hypothetical protein
MVHKSNRAAPANGVRYSTFPPFSYQYGAFGVVCCRVPRSGIQHMPLSQPRISRHNPNALESRKC